MSSLLFTPSRSFPTWSWRRSRPESRPISSSAWSLSKTTRNGPTRVGWSISRTPSATSSDLFDPDALDAVTLPNATTGRRGLYLLPVGFATHHVHAWKSLLEQAGFTLADIPKEWEAFWAFWCDQVQPAVRQALGRDDVWGVGLTMSVNSVDTVNGLYQFMNAYEADYVTDDGRLVIDDPEVRRRLIKAIDSYTAIYRKGCTPPDSITWANRDNNEAVPGAEHRDDAEPDALDPEHAQGHAARGLLRQRRDHRLARRRLRPAARHRDRRQSCAVFKDGDNVDTAKEFVRFLVGEGWLAHYLDFAGDRMLPTMPKLLQAPFWLDPATRTGCARPCSF